MYLLSTTTLRVASEKLEEKDTQTLGPATSPTQEPRQKNPETQRMMSTFTQPVSEAKTMHVSLLKSVQELRLRLSQSF